MLACESVLSNPPQDALHEGQISYKLGFVPDELKLHLPDEYAVWELFQTHLSDWIKRGSEREELSLLPLLEANDPIKLPNEYLALAASILANFAHIYYYNVRKGETQLEDTLPDSIRIPWEQVNERIGRKFLDENPKKIQAVRNQYDVLLCNWKSKKQITGENNLDIELDDLELINAPFNNREERVFNLAIVLMELRFAPAIKHIVQAIKSVELADDKGLIEALANITHVIDRVTEALYYINSNPNSEHYIDPNVWTSTIARVDKALPDGQPGLSANLMPFFHVMDLFIERSQYETDLGKSILERSKIQPQHIFNFLMALKSDLQLNSIKRYVEKSDNSALKSQYQSLLDAYVGPQGFLAAHKLKAFGILKINFRAGRSETNGGIKGGSTIESEPQRKSFDSFTGAMKERSSHYQRFFHTAVKFSTTSLGKKDKAYDIVLDISKSGIEFIPGDCCAIQPLNSQSMIDTIVEKLHLDPTMPMELTSKWKTYFHDVIGKTFTDQITISELLRYIDIGHAMKLKPDERMNINNLVPLEKRMYSVSQVPDHPGLIGLTVGTHNYTVDGQEFHGVASQYLIELAPDQPILIERIPGRFFRLPLDPQKPIIMFAAGTGISPFLGFINERKLQKESGKNWLFLSTGDRDSFYYKDVLEKAVAQGEIDCSTVFTRDSEFDTVVFDEEVKQFKYIKKYTESNPHIDVLIKENAKQICQLIQEGAYVYVCGSTGFSDSVRRAIEKELSVSQKDPAKYIDGLMADHRYNTDIFSAIHPVAKENHFYRSEVARHNKPNDCWMIINGHVYDLSQFMAIHPGGSKLMQITAGSDGSDDYNHILHNKNQKIEGQLATYDIGILDEPLITKELNQRLYKSWSHFLSALLEMENTLTNNTTFSVSGPPPMYLWNEAMGVFFDGRMAGFDSEGNVGSFKYTFGKLLQDLYQQSGVPELDLQDLFLKASACGSYLKRSSIGVSSGEPRCAQGIYKVILEKSLDLIGFVKQQVILLSTELETQGDLCEISERLPLVTQKINEKIRDYAQLIDHIFKSLNLEILPEKDRSSPLKQETAVVVPCIFAQMAMKGREDRRGKDSSDEQQDNKAVHPTMCKRELFVG